MLPGQKRVYKLRCTVRDSIQPTCKDCGIKPRSTTRKDSQSGWVVTHRVPGCCLDKYTAEEKPGPSPREKAPLLSDKAVLTPEEHTIGNETWAEN